MSYDDISDIPHNIGKKKITIPDNLSIKAQAMG